MPAARFVCASDRSLLVYLDEEISLRAHHLVLKLLRLLEAEPVAGVRNLHPAYCSVLVKFDPLEITHAGLETILRAYLQRFDDVHLPEPRQVEIPVRYGGEAGPDLDDVAKIHGMTPDQVVELHCAATYVVYFLGFVPGFPYLGGLPETLATPRLASPRRKVPAGSVGIGGNQTGIYPLETPGGWRLIGRTPVPIFEPGREDMCLFSIGDHVRFTAL
jgi:KipI family sensor histidine kinase inhibitor